MTNDVIYLDAGASALKPQSVIDEQIDFLANRYANAGRGVCMRATGVDNMVESARGRVAEFINAKSEQIVFTSGTTDGVNRIVNILRISKGFGQDSMVIVSDLDHHSARLPWEEMAYLGKCRLDLCELDADYNLDFHARKKVDVFVITAMSNVLGVPQDVKQQIKQARDINPNVITIVDAAQYVVHGSIDVADWDCDFLCFSGHKIGADTGIGIMYIKNPNRWAVDKLGGGMVQRVIENPNVDTGVISRWTLADIPARFEAGTQPLTQIAGLRPAIDELEKTRGNRTHIKYLYDELSQIPKIKILTSSDAHLLTFVVDGMHPMDFGAMMGAHNICVRVGNMCATWIHKRIGYDGTIRISAGPWNTTDEMTRVVSVIKKIVG